MSIVVTDPVTAYYIPEDEDDSDEEFDIPEEEDEASSSNPQAEPASSKNGFQSMQIYGKDPDAASQRIIELRYKRSDVKPSASQLKLEDFVTVQKVDAHPVSGVEGMTWCVLSCESPPEQENASRYVAALDYAMLEEFDAIVLEPFDLSQRTQQWINIMSMLWHIFGCYLSISLAATVSSRMMEPGATVMGLINVGLLKYYQKYAMGDPICRYRNLDFLSQQDMDKVFHMSELLAVRGAFSHVIIKDLRRERYRYNILKYMTGIQLGLCAYKYLFGMLLWTVFPDRPL